ncbi:hypothetical protein HEB29_003584 [Streptomyces fulvorobeus]|uniref:Uncharacterized protein n=1 Tax=Streptomyces fulvorobeus TaxID=284028 RepID=A0A7Y9HE12_9ACTN|nr:hypothetical protein [Streptomyces fulvorobeus]
MRKALIQTSAYWETRHYDVVDPRVDAARSPTATPASAAA